METGTELSSNPLTLFPLLHLLQHPHPQNLLSLHHPTTSLQTHHVSIQSMLYTTFLEYFYAFSDMRKGIAFNLSYE